MVSFFGVAIKMMVDETDTLGWNCENMGCVQVKNNKRTNKKEIFLIGIKHALNLKVLKIQ